MARQLRTLLALPGAEWWLLLQTAVLLPIVSFGLRLFGFRRCYAFLGRGGTPAGSDLAAARRTGALVHALALSPLYRANCLRRSLVLWWLLRRKGLTAVLRIGVQKEGEIFRAHAWVEHHGVPLNERRDVADQFRPFAAGIVPQFGGMGHKWDG